MVRRLTWPVGVAIIVVAGAAAFATGLGNPFNGGDDTAQIVANVPVHSISNFFLFFRGGTLYNGQGGDMTLSGPYYRPLMMATYSLLYTLFGPNPIAFHVVQLLFGIGGTVLLYLVFLRCSFSPVLSLVLSLLFLLHPMDSQALFSIPGLEDPLFFFFGILSFWVLLQFRSDRSLFVATLCLLLALFSKESGIVFAVMDAIYLFWWDRRRTLKFLGIVALAVGAYAAMRISAVGLVSDHLEYPIARVGLGGRLLTVPSILLLYLTKLVWPVQLATSYYFVQSRVTFTGVVLPVVIDVVAAMSVVGLGILVRRSGTRSLSRTYWFFAAWAVLGLGLLVQIVPLDATASESWFRFSMAGALGMAGVVATTFLPRVRLNVQQSATVAAAVLVVVFAAGTAARGLVWGNPMELARADLAADPGSFSNLAVANQYLAQHQFEQAKPYALEAVALFPNGYDYDTLGRVDAYTGSYRDAAIAYNHALVYLKSYFVVEHMAMLTTVYGDPASNRQFLLGAAGIYPLDAIIWVALANVDYNMNPPNIAEAQQAIAIAHQYAPGNQTITAVYIAINSGKPVRFTSIAP